MFIFHIKQTIPFTLWYVFIFVVDKILSFKKLKNVPCVKEENVFKIFFDPLLLSCTINKMYVAMYD